MGQFTEGSVLGPPKFDSKMGGNQQLYDDYNRQATLDGFLGVFRPEGYQFGGGYENWLKTQQQAPAQQQTPVPGFQPTWQQMGYSSHEAMKDALDPGWRNSGAQLIGGSFDSPIYGRFLGQPGGNMTPSPMPMPNQPAPIAEQVREQVASPIYGQGSPFQPPTPQQQMPPPQPPAQVQPPPQLPPAQMPVPQLPPSMPPSMPFIPRPDMGPDVGIGVPAQPASLFRPTPEIGRPNVGIGRPTEPFTGGLKPAPRNFRPPRVGSLRSRLRMR